MIIWVSLKTRRLTNSGVENIRNSIGDLAGMVGSLSEEVGGQNQNSVDEMLDEIHSYMETFRTLICIDNLESISAEELREFFVNIPLGSKVLVTSRVALGEIELRYKRINLRTLRR